MREHCLRVLYIGNEWRRGRDGRSEFRRITESGKCQYERLLSREDCREMLTSVAQVKRAILNYMRLADEDTIEKDSVSQIRIEARRLRVMDRANTRRRPGFVYIMARNDRPGVYKLGMSLDPFRRVREVESCSLVDCVEVRDRYVAERAIHGRFALRRDSDGSENFSLSDYEVRIVKRLFAEIRRQA